MLICSLHDLQNKLRTKAPLNIGSSGPQVDYKGETFLSQELALNLLNESKQAFNRCQLVSLYSVFQIFVYFLETHLIKCWTCQGGVSKTLNGPVPCENRNCYQPNYMSMEKSYLNIHYGKAVCSQWELHGFPMGTVSFHNWNNQSVSFPNGNSQFSHWEQSVSPMGISVSPMGTVSFPNGNSQFPQWEQSVSPMGTVSFPNGNSQFPQWEQSVSPMGTVSFPNGNSQFPQWEQSVSPMGTVSFPNGNSQFPQWEQSVFPMGTVSFPNGNSQFSNGNSQFSQWEQSVSPMGTVSFSNGNSQFPQWEQSVSPMGTVSFPNGNSQFPQWEQSVFHIETFQVFQVLRHSWICITQDMLVVFVNYIDIFQAKIFVKLLLHLFQMFEAIQPVQLDHPCHHHLWHSDGVPVHWAHRVCPWDRAPRNPIVRAQELPPNLFFQHRRWGQCYIPSPRETIQWCAGTIDQVSLISMFVNPNTKIHSQNLTQKTE